jgi:hypothetical protein
LTATELCEWDPLIAGSISGTAFAKTWELRSFDDEKNVDGDLADTSIDIINPSIYRGSDIFVCVPR